MNISLDSNVQTSTHISAQRVSSLNAPASALSTAYSLKLKFLQRSTEMQADT